MSAIKIACVLTSIQPPTACVRKLAERLEAAGARLIVMGDRKGPASFPLPRTDFYSLAAQLKLPHELTGLLPTGHYARKNLGYLEAIRRGASCIYETDDDNAPMPNWAVRERLTSAQRVAARPWLNVYRLFSDQLIWPRGFPLEQIRDSRTFEHDVSTALEFFDCPIQQGLADASPDVDAAWRLMLDRDFRFQPNASVWLPPGTWCPFNSQTTWWWPDAYPLMYLPSYCSFRMTDIWRSFIAQRCLWELGCGVAFHAPEVAQERNTHNLLRDFQEEVPGYLNNQKIVDLLADLQLCRGQAAVAGNLRVCYERLVAAGIFTPEETGLVEAWANDIARLTKA